MAERDKSVVLDAHGAPLELPATRLTADEAQLLKDYQLFGQREGLQGSMTCNDCGKQMEVYVQKDIGFFCDCRILVWQAS